MKAFEQLLLEEYLEKTNELNDLKENRICCCKVSILWAESKIAELHKKLKDYEFENVQDEINFFKKIKPFIISKLIFEKEVLRIETNKPLGKVQKRKYLEEELKKISTHPQKDINFYQYYRSETNENDIIYFTRASKKNIFETECFLVNSDPKLSTCYDYKVAKIKAFDELVKYLENEICNLKAKSKSPNDNNKSKFNWTGTKVDLTEMIYGFQAAGSINNGNFDLKEFAIFLGKMFNVEIDSNLYGNYSDIKSRKVPKTRFINTMSDKLIEKMDNEDSKKMPQ